MSTHEKRRGGLFDFFFFFFPLFSPFFPTLRHARIRVTRAHSTRPSPSADGEFRLAPTRPLAPPSFSRRTWLALSDGSRNKTRADRPRRRDPPAGPCLGAAATLSLRSRRSPPRRVGAVLPPPQCNLGRAFRPARFDGRVSWKTLRFENVLPTDQQQQQHRRVSGRCIRRTLAAADASDVRT